MSKPEGFEKAGMIDVDAGCVWVGDPCYLTPDEPGGPTRISDWPKFCRQGWDDRCCTPDVLVFGHDNNIKANTPGNAGQGICISTLYGDGTYPVYVRKDSSGRIAEVRIMFDPDEEDYE